MNRAKCPYCGKDTYSFFDRMIAGGMAAKGRPCRECGRRSVHGLDSAIFRTVLWAAALIIILINYKSNTPNVPLCVASVTAALVICRVADGFFGLAKNNRREE